MRERPLTTEETTLDPECRLTAERRGRLRAIGRAGRLRYKTAGAVMVLMGVAIMTGQLSAFAWWLLETFPVLGAIG